MEATRALAAALAGAGALAVGGLGPALAASGTLTQLEGAAGCIVDQDAATPIAGCATGRALLGARAVAISPDGRHAYVVAANSSAVAAFERSRKSGALHQLAGAAGCIVDDSVTDTTCATGRALLGAFNVTVSPDGRNVYVASEDADGVAVFERDLRSGALTQPDGAAGCIVDPANTTNTDCAVGRALQEPRGVVATWRFVYVAAGGSAAVAAFERDHASGGLTQIEGPGGCIVDADADPIDGCGTGRALARPRDLALIGQSLYAPSDRNDGVAVLIRSFHTGELSQNADDSACIVDAGSPLAGCAEGRALQDARGVAVSRDGRSVYVAARGSDGAAALARERRTGGLTQVAGPTGCIVDASAPVADCASGRALLQSQAIAASRDGRSVYNTGSASNALDSFARSRNSGGIEQLEGAQGCIVDAGGPAVSDCDNTGRALLDAQEVTVSPDDRTVYVASFNADAIAILDRGSFRPWRRRSH